MQKQFQTVALHAAGLRHTQDIWWRTLAALMLALLGYSLPQSALADWELDGAHSGLSFVSIKKNSVAEVHRFQTLLGRIGDNGEVQAAIALDSVDTGIAIRDQRMRDMLFETSRFGVAKVTAHVDSAALKNLKVGEFQDLSLTLNMELHGQKHSLSGEFRVLRLAGGGLAVNTLRPMVVNAADFGLDVGIQKLMEVAGLPSIATAVPVTLSLVFDPR